MTQNNNNQQKSHNFSDYHTYYNLGREFAKDQEWHKAIAEYKKALDIQDNIANIYHHWGDALLNLKNWRRAVTIYQKALELDPQLAWSYHNLGIALLKTNQLNESLINLQNAVQINPNNDQFHLSLGQLLVTLGQWQEAVATYQKVIDLGGKTAAVYHELGDIFSELSQWNDAISAYQLAINLDKQATWSYHNLGVALLRLQLAQEAITFFEQAIELDRNFASAYFNLGEAWRLQQKWDEAVAAYQQAITLEPNFPNLQITLADTLEQRAKADLDAALVTYHQALTTSKKPETIYQKIALILANQQKLDQALFYSNAAIELDRNNPDSRTFYQKLCEQRSKLAEFPPEKAIADHSYGLWCKYHNPTMADLRQFCWQVADIAIRPTISIILPLQESAITWIEETLFTIKQQVYPHWQLLLATATINQDQEQYWQQESQLSSLLAVYSKRDYRIQHLPCDNQMETAALANQALAAATGEWIAVLQPGTLLTPQALLEFVWQLGKNKTTDIIYGDEDQVKTGNLLSEPWFKPKWCPDLLLARNYFGSCVLYRHDLVKDIGGFHSGYGYAYDYDLSLRLTEQTQQITHVSRIVAHSKLPFNKVEDSTKAVSAAIKRRGETAVVKSHWEFPEIKTVHYEIATQDLVSIIIPTRNLGKMLNQCLNSIFELTTYSNYEVIVVDNGSDDSETLAILQKWQAQEPERFKVLSLDVPFNYSLLNNRAVLEAQGKYLLFLNNDTTIITTDWLEGMIAQAQRPTIGAVGAYLLYPDDTVQHAGVILGVTGIAGHGHRYYPSSDTGYQHALITTTNYSAVTGACLMCRREVFDAIGGFNEQLAVAYNDVDFCLKLQKAGFYNIWLPHVQLYHHESQSRTPENTPEKQQRIFKEVAYMEETWGELIKNDPCYNVNLTREKENYALNLSYQREIESIFLAEVPEEQLHGFFLDEPKIGCLKGNSLDIIGWVVGNIAEAVTLEVIGHGEVIATTEINQNRPDVAMVFSEIPEAANSGFVLAINLAKLSPKVELVLQVVLANQTKIRLIKIQLG